LDSAGKLATDQSQGPFSGFEQAGELLRIAAVVGVKLKSLFR
jgi:hypothetical protein